MRVKSASRAIDIRPVSPNAATVLRGILARRSVEPSHTRSRRRLRSVMRSSPVGSCCTSQGICSPRTSARTRSLGAGVRAPARRDGSEMVEGAVEDAVVEGVEATPDVLAPGSGTVAAWAVVNGATRARVTRAAARMHAGTPIPGGASRRARPSLRRSAPLRGTSPTSRRPHRPWRLPAARRAGRRTA